MKQYRYIIKYFENNKVNVASIDNNFLMFYKFIMKIPIKYIFRVEIYDLQKNKLFDKLTNMNDFIYWVNKSKRRYYRIMKGLNRA